MQLKFIVKPVDTYQDKTGARLASRRLGHDDKTARKNKKSEGIRRGEDEKTRE